MLRVSLNTYQVRVHSMDADAIRTKLITARGGSCLFVAPLTPSVSTLPPPGGRQHSRSNTNVHQRGTAPGVICSNPNLNLPTSAVYTINSIYLQRYSTFK